jgi:5-methylcytosine-specific restriction endonuclease McrA
MKCSEDSCKSIVYKLDMCQKHYRISKFGVCRSSHEREVPAGSDGLCYVCRHNSTGKCQHDGCENVIKAKKLCGQHYGLEKYGWCTVKGCFAPAHGKNGLCYKDNLRLRKSIVAAEKHPNRFISIIKTGNRYCSSCERFLEKENFYASGGPCKKCTSLRKKRYRGDGWRYGIENVIQTNLGLCVKCWSKLSDWHCDHIVPSSKGGKDDVGNLQIMCSTCNCSKNNRESKDYRIFIRRGFA